RSFKKLVGLPAFSKMDLDKIAEPALPFPERMKRFHHAGAFGPPRAGSSGERDHRNLAFANSLAPEIFQMGIFIFPRYEEIVLADVLYRRCRRQAVLRKADAAASQIGANLLVRFTIETKLVQQLQK